MDKNMTVAEILESLNNELEALDLEIEETEEVRNTLTEELNTKRKARTRLKNRIKNVNKNLLGIEEESKEEAKRRREEEAKQRHEQEMDYSSNLL